MPTDDTLTDETRVNDTLVDDTRTDDIQSTATTLSALQQALEENAEYYHAAAINSAHDAVASFLRSRAQERMEFARELAPDESPAAGESAGEPSLHQNGDDILARLRRGVLTITAGMTITSENVDKRVLEGAQNADARLQQAYEAVLARDDLSESLRQRVAFQHEQIQATYAYTGTRASREFDTVVLGLFARDEDLHSAVNALKGSGLPEEQLTVVGSEAVVETLLGDRKADLTASTSGVAAIGGTLLGGFLGFLAGLGTIMVPGVGQVLAVSATATVLGSTAIGAGVGAAEASFLGMFIGLGVAEDDIHRYTTGVKRGELLLIAHVPADDAAAAAEKMRRHQGTDVSVRTDERLPEND